MLILLKPCNAHTIFAAPHSIFMRWHFFHEILVSCVLHTQWHGEWEGAKSVKFCPILGKLYYAIVLFFISAWFDRRAESNWNRLQGGQRMGEDRGYKIVATVISRQGACQFGRQVGDTVVFETQRIRE